MSKCCNRCGQTITGSGHVCSPAASPGVAGVMGHGRSVPVYGPNGEAIWVEHEPGLSKREAMAMHLMAGVAGAFKAGTMKDLAQWAVTAADALLEELGA